VRHFLELFPALGALAALGVAESARRLAALLPGVRAGLLGAALGALALAPGVAAVVRTHPFQLAYFNVFVGGYPGALARALPQAGDYWALSYRQGIRWLNAHAEPDAFLAVPVAEHAVRLVAPEWLRSDLTLLPLTSPLSPRIPPTASPAPASSRASGRST
jgi:hypothetical protein